MLTSCQSALTRTLQVHMCELGGEDEEGKGKRKGGEMKSNCCYATKSKCVPPLFLSFLIPLLPHPTASLFVPFFPVLSSSFLLPPYSSTVLHSSLFSPSFASSSPPLFLSLTSVQSCVVVKTCAVSALFPSPADGRGVAQ